MSTKEIDLLLENRKLKKEVFRLMQELQYKQRKINSLIKENIVNCECSCRCECE